MPSTRREHRLSKENSRLRLEVKTLRSRLRLFQARMPQCELCKRRAWGLIYVETYHRRYPKNVCEQCTTLCGRCHAVVYVGNCAFGDEQDLCYACGLGTGTPCAGCDHCTVEDEETISYEDDNE